MRILCLGDSIMQYNDWTSYPQTGWVQLLDRFFNTGVQILNFARNGRSSKSFIAEGRFENVLKEAKKGDFALIQFAHNDEKANDPSRYTEPGPNGEFHKNLEFMAGELVKKGVKPILLTPVVRRKFDENKKIKNSHGEYPAAIKETAEKLSLPCIDLTGLTASYFEGLGEEKSRSYFMNFDSGLYENFAEGKSDDSHLRPDGAYSVCHLFVGAVLKHKDEWKTLAELSDFICTKGIYSDKEIDDEKLFW